MATQRKIVCCVDGCGEAVPVPLAEDRMCLDHFVERTYARARRAVENYQADLPFRLDAVEWMFEDAKFAIMAVVRDIEQPYREKVSELMISLANLHEFVRCHTARASAEARQAEPVLQDAPRAAEAQLQAGVARSG